MAKQIFFNARRIFVSILIGITTSCALAFYFFNAYVSVVDRLFLFVVPSISAAICVYYLLPILEKTLFQLSILARVILFVIALLSTILIATSIFKAVGLLSIAAFVSLLFVFFAAIIQPAPFLEKLDSAKKWAWLFFGWAFSAIVIFIVAGFLDNFYNSYFEITCIIAVLYFIIGPTGYYLVKRLGNFAKQNTIDFMFFLALFLVLFIFIGILFQYGEQFPALFTPGYFLLGRTLLPVFGAVSVLIIPWQAWAIYKLESPDTREKFKSTKLYTFINENLPGVALALVFFAIYFLIATVLNHPRFDVDDIFFDADVFNWRLRLTTDNWQDYYWRSVHPFVLLLLKPPIDLVAILFKGDKLFGAYIVVALSGATCVFLAWKFIKAVTGGNTIYAALVASILGLSASHLIFGSLIETYIFLAASLLLFYFLLLKESPISALIFASLPAVGITYTNFAQNTIAFFTIKPNVKTVFRFVATVLVFLVQLSLLNNLFFPGAHPFFFVPSALLAEEQNIFPLNPLRIHALTRAFLFQNIVAPTPILYTGDIPFTQFRFFKPEINKLSGYDTPSQTFTAWFWLGLILLGMIVFLMNYKKYKSNRFSLALLGCMLLNFGLHLRYGKELFLYSPNWTYALILLLALAWQGLANHRWFQITLLVFLVFLMLNNSLLFGTIFSVLASYLN